MSIARRTELWLIRHGETEWSAAGRHTSDTDLDLTAAGVASAEELPAKLADTHFANVLTSPLLRARRTAEIAGFPDAEHDADLVEWKYGDYEGLTSEEIHAFDPDWTVWTSPSPGGESAERVASRLDRIVDRALAVNGRTLVFAHGHSLRALAARWLGLEVSAGRLFALDTSTISVLQFEHASHVIGRWNA